MRLLGPFGRPEFAAMSGRRTRQLILAVLAATWLGAPPSARATPVDYEIDFASAVIGFDLVQITGFFTFDAATLPEPTESDVNLFVSFMTPFDGTYTQIAAAETEPNVVFATGGPGGGNTLILDFANDFGSPLPVDPRVGPFNAITGVMIETATESHTGIDIFGDAFPVPEPPTLPLLSGVLGLLVIARTVVRQSAE